ncbi:hypothetical protein [Massilia endophytica]|uniref:hypothetical protein n=1 Tax=Massilia endophytica TaxID=2899220 RepID=UPI001E2D972A|nr:hypothetical protein [Massilia endophytica]UGQ45064.1 hypothetical protein LSQ66_14820 [Massilia endophytica]
MDTKQAFATAFQYLGFLGITAVGFAGAAYALFKWLGSKWLENKFAERLQNLKAEQDHSIRMVQSSIDREIHRAKKLYDNEFTALTESWRLLRLAFDSSAASIGSMVADVSRMNADELERHLTKRGMEEWQRRELSQLAGQERQHEYYIWSEWQRAIDCNNKWRECRQQVDATSIFFPDGFTEKFRSILELIIGSNVEFEYRILEYKKHTYGQTWDSFQGTKELERVGRPQMAELERMVRARLWSVAKDSD